MVAEALGRREVPPGTAAESCTASAERPTLAAVYESHFRYVWRCLRSLGVRDAQLDDALQDVFVVVQRKLDDFDGRAELRTWLYAIALRIARKYRERAMRDPLPLPLEPELGGTDAEGAVTHHERLALARLALEALSDDQREVFVLARVEQMSAPEMAEVIGIPLNTVYSRLRAARLAFEAEVARLKTSPRSKS
ncbi:MAG TPA: sigma-70 family RNA polymerase sigma factor [Polyangiaceae bacterium]|jgi:RNA polymerase sigma-70 factor (ECF subfamily)|nr:sigma-70 family RNA polymerase sigma factor [Polyangiaceae bacterium]